MLDRKTRRCPVCSGPLILNFRESDMLCYRCDHCEKEYFKDE